MESRVAIIGDGQMGLVLGDALAVRGVPARLWGPFKQDIEDLASTRQSPSRLPGFTLSDAIEVTSDASAVLDGADIILNCIPTQFIRPVWTTLAPYIPAQAPVLCVSKGVEIETLMRPTEIISDVLGEQEGQGRSVCSMCGPTVAAELAKRLPATLVAASTDLDLAGLAQELFNVPWLRIYRHDDLLGVELAGATKNVIALAAGMTDGLEVGDNAKSALLARGLAEIARLGVAMGAKRDTFFGIAGVGDLATTCFSPCGRNRTCGERIGRGESLESILESTVSVVEGVPTTQAVARLAKQHQVEMPITEAVRAILFDGLDPRDAIVALMQRSQKAERIG